MGEKCCITGAKKKTSQKVSITGLLGTSGTFRLTLESYKIFSHVCVRILIINRNVFL